MPDKIDDMLAEELARGDANLAASVTGVAKPKQFMVLDASVMDQAEVHEIVREDIRRNHIEYVFPDGINKVDIFEECRALTMLDDFDTIYDLTMQMLVGKPLTIVMKFDDGTKEELATIQIVDRGQNLRGYDIIDEYPVLITWLTEFVSASLLKKYPPLVKNRKQAQVAEKVSDKKNKLRLPKTPGEQKKKTEV